MNFSIGFIRDRVTDLEPGEKAKLGRIRMGNTSERFLVSLNYWTVGDYQNHWKDALDRIVQGKLRSALITSMHNPRIAKYIFWRPLYRVENRVYIQDHILFLDKWKSSFAENNPFKYVGSRRIPNENKEPSEWSVSVRDIASFLRTVEATKSTKKRPISRL